MIKTQMNDKEKNKRQKKLKVWLLDLHGLTCWLALSFSQLLHIHIQVIGAVSTCNHRSLWMFLGVVTYSYIFFSNHLITQKDARNWINTEITNWIIIFDLFKNHWYQKTFVQWKDDLAVAFAICVVYCKIKVTEWAETPIRKFIWLIQYLPVPKIVFWKHCCTQLMLNRHTSLIMLHNLKISPNLFKFLITSTLK